MLITLNSLLYLIISIVSLIVLLKNYKCKKSPKTKPKLSPSESVDHLKVQKELSPNNQPVSNGSNINDYSSYLTHNKSVIQESEFNSHMEMDGQKHEETKEKDFRAMQSIHNVQSRYTRDQRPIFRRNRLGIPKFEDGKF